MSVEERTCHKQPDPQAAVLQKPMLSRLNRIEGQVRGIKKMIEEDAYCDDIIHQVSATRAALREVQCILLENHLRHCVTTQLAKGDMSVVDEIVDTVRKMTR